MPRTVVGVFQESRQAGEAVARLEEAGFQRDEISVLARDRAREGAVEVDTTAQNAVLGAAAGGAAGALGGLVLGLAPVLIPVIGPILALGPVVAALGGLVAGAGAGGILGAIMGLGVPENEAAAYEEALMRGDVLVLVKAPGRAAEAAEILGGSGASSTHEGNARGAPEAAAVLIEEPPAALRPVPAVGGDPLAGARPPKSHR